jgi:DNA-binding NarL/FixJ family response regulator
MVVVGEAENGAAALQLIEQLRPDVLLLDLRMPGADGTQVAQQVRQRFPSVKVLIVTSYDEDEHLVGALRAGAHGYVLKSAPPDQLLEAVRVVGRGERYVGPRLVDRVLRHFETLARGQAKASAGLSDEDLAVLRLISLGATNREVASRLFWSEVTVKRRLHEIYRKLGVNDRARAVATAMSRGLL